MFNDSEIRELGTLSAQLTRDTRGQIVTYDQMGETAQKAYDTLKKRILAIIEANSRLNTSNQKLLAAERLKNHVVAETNKVYLEARNYYKEHESGIRHNIDLNKKWNDILEKIHTGDFGDDINKMKAEFSALQVATKEAGAETLTLHGILKKLFNFA